MLKRTSTTYVWYSYMNSSMHEYKMPAQLYDSRDSYSQGWRNKVFHTKSRAKWDYNRIDDQVNNFSEFRKTHDRPDFGGAREDNWTLHNASMKNPPHVKRLYEYFDKYTDRSQGKKGDKYEMAAQAVKEQWDSDNFYYPGESWEQNRPAFRSVPKEILNKHTMYSMHCIMKKPDMVQTTSRNRAWNPSWPPPGYKLPAYNTKREFVFGGEDPGLLAEVERFYWHKMWADQNERHGPFEMLMTFLIGLFTYNMCRNHLSSFNMETVAAGQWYPGAHFITPYGEPTKENGNKFWWQTDMKDWPNQFTIHSIREWRFGYINYQKRKAAQEEAESHL